MLKRIWYRFFKIFIGTGLFFFFKKISVHNVGNIPKKGAILFVSNHKNALIDPLLIATTMPRTIHFLTRASAFKLKPVHWFLSTLNLIPIYRMRDGKETLAKNEAIFNTCYHILNKKGCLLIFPEGTHDIRRWVRPLSKGFTRITFGALAQNPDLKLHIVPIGLNYTNAAVFGESVSVYYGEPILANDYFDEEALNTSTQNLKAIVHEKLKELTTHIPVEKYEETITKLGAIDFLNPLIANELIQRLPNSNLEASITNTISKKEPSMVWKTLKLGVAVNSFFPLLIYRIFLPKIEEIEFVSTTKFAIGLTAFPLFYTLQSLAIAHFFGWQYALFYLAASILSVLLLAKTK